jgi:Uma2 family endonuclease
MAAQGSRRLFTVNEYYRMGDAGILTGDDRVELIEGEVVRMTAIGNDHAACVDRLHQLFSRSVADRAVVRVQSPIRLSEFSEPQPDLALLQPRADFYATAHPGPQDVLLVVEVVDSSTGIERLTKMTLYSRCGIPEAWLVHVHEDGVETHRGPTPHGYCEVKCLGRGSHMTVEALPDLTFAVDDILGPPLA